MPAKRAPSKKPAPPKPKPISKEGRERIRDFNTETRAQRQREKQSAPALTPGAIRRRATGNLNAGTRNLMSSKRGPRELGMQRASGQVTRPDPRLNPRAQNINLSDAQVAKSADRAGRRYAINKQRATNDTGLDDRMRRDAGLQRAAATGIVARAGRKAAAPATKFAAGRTPRPAKKAATNRGRMR